MDIKRRNLLKLISLGAVIPGELLLSDLLRASPVNSSQAKDPIIKLFEKAHVIDGLVISRGWDEDSFTALKKSGYSGFSTSLASGNLKAALNSLED